MKSIQIYKQPKVLSCPIVGGGVLMLVFGVIQMATEGYSEWSPYFNIAQGILFILLWRALSSNRKYVISWDEQAATYRLRGDKSMSRVNFRDVAQVSVSLYDIVLTLTDGSTKKLHLQDLDYSDLKEVKEKFEEVSTTR